MGLWCIVAAGLQKYFLRAWKEEISKHKITWKETRTKGQLDCHDRFVSYVRGKTRHDERQNQML